MARPDFFSDIFQDISQLREMRDPVTLQASTALTASGTGADVTSVELERANQLLIVCNVNPVTGTTPTMNLVVQAKAGAFYWNLATFTQFTGALVASYLLSRFITTAVEVTPSTDPAVPGAPAILHGAGWLNILRVKYTIAGTTPSFTTEVLAYPLR